MISKESMLLKSCLELLSWKKIFHYRNNSGAFKTDRGGFYRFGESGSPDIIAILRIGGLSAILGLELKVNKNKATPNQTNWGKRFESEANGFWFIIRNLEDLEKSLKYVHTEAMQIMQKGILR